MDTITLEDAGTGAEVLPGLGAKITSLFDKRRNREWLWRTPDSEFRRPRYGDTFEDYDLSGFDDCFPTVGECPHPDPPWQGVVAPDHGELWPLPWKCQQAGDTVACLCDGRRFPYRFERRISLLPEGGVRVEYHVGNESDHDFRCVWSAHPLLAISPGARLSVPDDAGLASVTLGWSLDSRFGDVGTRHSFPLTVDDKETTVDLSLAPPRADRWAVKLFSDRLRSGACAVVDATGGAALELRWPVEVVPYLGLWLNYNGIPADSPHYNVAPEPCTGPAERLDDAIARGECTTIAPRSEVAWWLEMAFAAAKE